MFLFCFFTKGEMCMQFGASVKVNISKEHSPVIGPVANELKWKVTLKGVGQGSNLRHSARYSRRPVQCWTKRYECVSQRNITKIKKVHSFEIVTVSRQGVESTLRITD